MLVPTVYSLWVCPNMLQPLYTYSEVSPKVRLAGCHAHTTFSWQGCCSVHGTLLAQLEGNQGCSLLEEKATRAALCLRRRQPGPLSA